MSPLLILTYNGAELSGERTQGRRVDCLREPPLLHSSRSDDWLYGFFRCHLFPGMTQPNSNASITILHLSKNE